MKKSAQIAVTLSEAFSDLVFDEPTHTYTSNGKTLISSTTSIKRFCEEFDDERMAKIWEFKSKRQGGRCKHRTAEYYLKRWEHQRISAEQSGSRVHSYIEYNYPNFYDPPACKQELGAIQFFKNLDPRYHVVCLELRMCNEEYGKAGTTDCLLYDEQTDTLVIADWKTNNNNIIQYYQDKRMLSPFDSMYDTDLNKYTLQLSDYQNMICMATDYVVSDRWVVHLTSNSRHEVELSKQLAAKDHMYNIDTIIPIVEHELYTVYSVPDVTQLLMSTYSK